MRPIDADKLIEQIKKIYCEGCDNYNGMRCKACPNDDEIRDIDSAPTIDAVSVVRCKDCKWHTSDDECISPKWDFEERVVYPTTYSYDFCSYGERKDNGKDL